MTDEEGRSEDNHWVRRVATGCTDMGTALIGCGGVLWGMLIVAARMLPDDIANDASEVLRDPLLVVPSIPYWLSAITLLVGGMRLLKPNEPTRRFLDRSSLLLIALWAAAFAFFLALESSFVMAYAEGPGELGSSLIFAAFFLGLPVAIAIGYLWRLRDALWSPGMIEACGGARPEDLELARRAMNRQVWRWMLAAAALAALVTLSVMRGVEY
jgi:hypothetical protein